MAEKYAGGVGPKYHRRVGVGLHLPQTILNEKKALG